MKTISFTALAALLLVLTPRPAAAEQFIVAVSGKRQFQTTVKGKNKIASEKVTLASIASAFGVDPKKSLIVYDTDTQFLKLVPKPGVMGSTFTVLAANASLASYNSDAPLARAATFDLAVNPSANGTPFAGLQGLLAITTRLKVVAMVNQPTGVLGSVTGVATTAATLSTFTFTFSGTKRFQLAF